MQLKTEIIYAVQNGLDKVQIMSSFYYHHLYIPRRGDVTHVIRKNKRQIFVLGQKIVDDDIL